MAFSGIQTGLSGLLAYQRALDVTGQNLANVNTEGYSRERVELVADAGGVNPARYARSAGPGEGVRSTTISRFHDQFAEVRAQQEHALSSSLAEVQTALHTVEGALGEPSDSGIAQQLADFWADWDDVANNPTDLAARSQLLQQAKTLADSFHRIDGVLSSQRDNDTAQLQATITDVNNMADQIAQLNERIHVATTAGSDASQLLDQRDLIMRKLADKIGATGRISSEGSLDVFVGGTALVSNTTAQKLSVNVSNDAARNVQVVWTTTGVAAEVAGQAGGLASAIQDVLPRYRDALADVAQQVQDTVNAVHSTGYDLDGVAGQAFFITGPDGIQVNPALFADPRKVAASGDPNATFDGSVAQLLAGTTAPDVAYRQLVGALGIESSAVDAQAQTQGTITTQADAARESASGVNLDEEMANLIAIQHAYDASARFITAMDQVLDTLIHGTGTVGR